MQICVDQHRFLGEMFHQFLKKRLGDKGIVSIHFTRGGGNVVLFMVRGRAIFRGTFFETVTELWVAFSQFFDI